jgi:hypothetical protein
MEPWCNFYEAFGVYESLDVCALNRYNTDDMDRGFFLFPVDIVPHEGREESVRNQN